MAWAKNGTPHTLGSASQPLTISDLTAKTFNLFLSHMLDASTTSGLRTRFNNISSAVYALRRSNNGAADSTAVSATQLNISGGGVSGANQFTIEYVVSVSGEEKLVIGQTVEKETSGAANAPDRQEWVGKFVPSPDADITRIDHFDNDAGNYETGSNLSALGGDVTEEVILGNNQSGSRFEATDTRKIYYRVLPSVTFEEEYTSNTGWTQVGSLVTVNSHVTGKVAVNNAGTNAEHRVYKSIGTTLNDTKWFCDFDLWVDSGTSTSFPLALTSGTGGTPENSGVNEDVIAVAIDGNKLGIMHRNGSTASYTAFTSISTSTNYYCRLIRDSATQATLKVWTNSNRTGATAISDIVKTNIPSDVVNLAYLQHSTYSQGGGSSGVSWEVDNVDIYNGATSTTDLVWTEEV